MEDPERSTLSSLDLYSDMIGETEEMTGEMEEISEGGRGQADLYSDMLGETEEINDGGRGQMDLYSDMLEETEEMSEGGRGQADLYSDMVGETEEMSARGRGQVEEHSVMSSMDLYEDIIEEERENEKFEELRSEVTKTAGQMEDLMAQMEHVQTEKQSLAAENRALKKNISVLFVTAKSELDRKQKEIAQLRADLDMLRMRRGAPRIPHSTRSFDNRSDHSRPGPSGRQSTITREASSTHKDVADRQPGNYRQNYQQGESPERDRSRREGTGVSKSHPEHRYSRSSKSPEKDQDRRDGTRDRTCYSKHTKSDLKSRETKQQTGEKTDRSAGEGSTPRQASQDRDKLKTKETEEIKNMDGKTEEHGQEKSRSAGERTGPHTPTYPHPDSEQEATVGQTALKEPVPGGPKTPPEPYPYEDAANSGKLKNDSEKHHNQEGGRHKIAGDDIKNRKHSKERQKDSAYCSSGSKSLCGRENSLEDRREEHKQEGYRNKMAGHGEGRGHSGDGKKDSAYCSSGSESLGRHSRESSSEKKREEYEKDKRRGEDSRLDSKTRKETRQASREKHQKDGRSSREKSLERKREEHEPGRRENNITSGDLRQKLSQKKLSRDRSKEKSSDDSKKGDHDKRKAAEQKEHNSRKSKESSRHGKETSSRITERGRERHREEERSKERDRSNSRLQREGRRKGDKGERSQLAGDTREAQKRKRSSSGEHRHLKERRKVSPPRKKQYEKDRDGREKSKERKQSSSRHKDRSEGRKKERSRRRSSERSNSLLGNSKEPDRRGHRSKFVNYRDRSEDRDSDPDSRRSLSVETDSSLGSSSAGSTADVQKHLPTSFEGSLHSSRSGEAGQQDRVAALTSPVRGSSFNEEPIETDAVEEGTDALDKQDTAGESQKHYKNGDKLKEKTYHPTSPHRGKSDREKATQNSPDCATEAGSSQQQPVTTGHQLQEKPDESEMEEEVTSTTTEQPDREADVRVRVDSDSCAEELGSILAPVKRKREDATQGHVTSPAAKKKRAAQNTPTKKGRLSPRKNVKRSPSKKGVCSPKKSPKKIPQEVAESEITPNTSVSPQKTPKKLVKSPQTSPKKATLSPQDAAKKVFKSPQKTPKKSSATPKKKSKSPRKTENLVEKCRSIVWTGKSAKGKTVNLFHIEYETAENAAREVFRNSPLLSPVKPPTPQLNLSARSSDFELPSGEESCSLPLPAISAQLKTDKRDMEQPIPSYHGSLSFSSFHANTDTNLKRFDQTEKVNQQQKEQSLPESIKSGTSSQLPFVPSEDTSRSDASSLEEQDFPRTVVPFSGESEVSETQEPVSTLLPTKEVKQQTNSESTGPFEVSINAESVTPDSDLKDNMQTQDGHASSQKGGEEKEDDLTSTEDNTAEDGKKATVEEETEELPLKTDKELRRSVETSLLSISNEFDSSTANLSNEELFAVEVLAQLAAAAKTPTHSPVKPAFSLQQASPWKGGTEKQKGGAKKSPMKVAVTGSTPYRLFSPGRLEPTIAAEVEVGSGCTPKKGSRQRKYGMDSPFIPPQPSALGSKKEKAYKKSTDKGSKKTDEKKKRDRKEKQSAEVLAIPEQDSKAKKTKVPPQEVKPLRSSPRKPQGKTADAARLPRKSPRKPSTVTSVESREEAAVVDIGQQKTKGSLQENQTLMTHHKEARKTGTSLSVARSSDHNTESASYCVWQTRQTPERERESSTDLEQNSCPDRLPHDDLEDMPNVIVLSPKSNGFQTRLMKKNVTQSEMSAHDRSEANKPSLDAKIGTTNKKQIINSSPETIQSDSKSNQKDLLTVPISSRKCVSTDLQQTDCSNKDNPGTDSIGQTSPKVHDLQNTKETVPNDSLSKGIQKQPEQMVTSTSSPLHPPYNRTGTNLGEKPAPNQTSEYNSTATPARQGEEGARVDSSASKGDSKVVKEVEPMQTGETTESLAANASTEENQAPLGKYKVGRTEESQTALSQEKQEINTGKSTLGEEELDVAAKHGVQTSDKPQPQTSLSPDTDVEEEEIEEGECTSSDEEEEELNTTVLLPCTTSEENAAHNSIETAASFNSDTSLPRPSTPTGLRQEMTLDQFSVLDPGDLRCQSAMSIDVRLIPSTPSGKMGPPSRGATPSGKDTAPTPGKSNPALPKTPAEKRQSGAFRQLFNSPPGGRFASTPAAERPKPPRFQLDMSVISTGKEEDSQCPGTPVVGDIGNKTRQDIRDTSRKADIVKQCETVDIAVQGSSKLHAKDLKHLEADKMHGQTEKERKTSGEKKTWTPSGSGRVNAIIVPSPKLAPPRRLPSKTDAFRKHLADENLKKDSEDTKQQKEESHKKMKSVRTPVKNMKRKDLDPSDFFPDVSSDEDDVSDGLADQEEAMESPPPESKVSLIGKETIAHVEEVSSVRKQLPSSEAPWQQQAEETAKRNSVDMPSAFPSVAEDMPSATPSAKVSFSRTSSINQPMKQISTNSPASAAHQKDLTQGACMSDRQASVTFGKAVPGKDKASNNNTVTDTAVVEAGSSSAVTAPKEKATGLCIVQSKTGLVAGYKQDAAPNTVDTLVGLSGTDAPMSTSHSPDQNPSLTDPPSLPMPLGVSPSVHTNIQTLPNHGRVAFQQPLSKEQPSTLPLHNISPEPCRQKSVIPTPLPSDVENVAVQEPMPPNSSADGIFRVPLPPMNREPPLQPANVSQPTPPVYVAERPIIKLNKFSYAAICALEANYGYEWLWPVKPQAQELLPAKQEPDFLPSTTGSQEAKLFVTTCGSNIAAHQPSSLHSQPLSASTQILQSIAGGESQPFSAVTSSVAFGNQNHRNARTGRDRASGVVTSKVEGKTVKELLSKSRKQQGKVHQQTGLVTGIEVINTGRNNEVFPGLLQAAVPPATCVFLPGVSQTQGVSQVVGGPQVPSASQVTVMSQVPGMSPMTGVSQVPGVLPSTVGNTAQVLCSANRNIFDALSGERLGVSNTPVEPPVTGTPVLTSQHENVRTRPTAVMPPNPNQQKTKEGIRSTTPKDVPPHTQTPDSKTCNKRVTSPNPDIWYQAFSSPKAAAQNTEMSETQTTTAHKEKGTGVVKKCLEVNHQEAGEGDLSEGEIVSDDEDITIVKSSGTSSYRDSHCREKLYTGTFKRNEGSSVRQNNRQHSEQRLKDDRNSHRSRGQKALDMKRDTKHTEHSRHGSRRPASEEVRLREQNYKEGWGRGGRGRTEHGRGEKVSQDRAPASWEGEQVSRKASKVERKARR